MKSADYAAWCAAIFTAMMALVTILALLRDSNERRVIAVNQRRDIAATVTKHGGKAELRFSNQSGQVIRNWEIYISGLGVYNERTHGSIPTGTLEIEIGKFGEIENAQFDIGYWEHEHKFSRLNVYQMERLIQRRRTGYKPEIESISEAE